MLIILVTHITDKLHKLVAHFDMEVIAPFRYKYNHNHVKFNYGHQTCQ